MTESESDRKAQGAWERIESLGGHGVWEPEMVIASLAGTSVADDDLDLFRDFPYIQTLDLSHTGVGDSSLAHLAWLPALEHLIIVDTKITGPAIKAFERAHPSVKVTTTPPPKNAINPFTGKPF